MRSARMTVLMTPQEKAEIEAEAARLGVSGGEYVRLAVDNFDRSTADEEAKLALLVSEANAAIPKIAASIERISARMEAMARKNEAFLKQMGMER